MVEKKVKKYGGSLVIVFDKEDIERYGIVEGDWIELGDMIIQSNERRKKQ